MGRTLPSATQLFQQEEQSLAKFRRALRREDQSALDDLFTNAQHHVAAMAYAAHLMPMEIMLIAMLLEEHKEVIRLREQIQSLMERQSGSRLPEPGKLF